MNRSGTGWIRTARTAGVLVCVAGGLGVLTPSVEARQAVVVAGGPGPGGGGAVMGGRFSPPVTQSQLEGYAELLKLSDEQRDSARELLEAMQAEFAKVAAENREQMKEIQAEFQETRDMQVMLKAMPQLLKEFREKRTELETAFFDDVKLTLNEEQAARWPAIERMRRRDLAGNGTMLSGESTDLIKLTKDLEFPASVKSEIAPVLERYEVDFDRALVDRSKLLAEQQGLFEGGGAPDPQTMMAKMNDLREQSVKVRDVNRSYARQIQNLLPPDEAQRFQTALQKESFPQVYGSAHALRSLDAALALDDLTADQRAALKDIRDAYAREADALNAKWAEAIEADEADPNAGNIAMLGGQTMRIVTREGDGGSQEESALAKASAARRDLDSRTLDRAKALLSADQQARLPKRQVTSPAAGWTGQPGDGAPPPDAVIMEVTESHDGVNEPQRSVRVSRPATGESTEVTSGGAGGSGGEGTPPQPPPPPPAPQ